MARETHKARIATWPGPLGMGTVNTPGMTDEERAEVRRRQNELLYQAERERVLALGRPGPGLSIGVLAVAGVVAWLIFK